MNTAILNKLDDLKTKTQTSMRTNPMKWAGVAAGTGFALGLAGRILQRRANHSSVELYVIENV